MHRLPFYLLILLISITCSPDDYIDDSIPYSQECNSNKENSMSLLTGLRLFDQNGSPLGQVGNPNINNDQKFYIYPNPNNGMIQVGKNTEGDYTMYIVPANKDTTCQNLDYSNFNFDYSLDSIQQSAELFQPLLNDDRISLKLDEHLLDGYYRLIFYEEGKPLYIENIYFEKKRSINEIYEFLLGEF